MGQVLYTTPTRSDGEMGHCSCCERDSSRRRGPFPGDEPHPERSRLFLYLNTGKKSITPDLENPAGRNLLRQLVSRVDMVVHDYTPASAAVESLDAMEDVRNLAALLSTE